MNEQVLRDHYARRGFSQAQTDEAVTAVLALQEWLAAQNETLESAEIPHIRGAIRALIEEGGNKLDVLLALARYFYLTGRIEIYVYFTSLLGGVGVIDSISSRLGQLVSREAAEELVNSVPMPPLGADPAEYPAFTRALMERLEERLPESTVRCALAGNHHQIPAEEFEEDVKLYQLSDSLDDFLRAKHTQQVATLQHYCDTNTVWFEQIITQDVVDFVAADQEIQSAVRDGDMLYTTKIPYDPDPVSC